MFIKGINFAIPKEGSLAGVLFRLTIVLIALALVTARPSKKQVGMMTDVELTVPDSINGLQDSVNASSPKAHLEIVLNRANPECNPAYFGEKTWIGFNVYDNTFAPNSPWDKSKLKFEDNPSSNNFMSSHLIYDSASLENSLRTKTEVSASYMVFSMSASAEYARSTHVTSTSTSVDVVARHDFRSLNLPMTNADLVAMMTEDAKKLAKNDPSAFVDKYGTHFISMQQYGCMARLQGSYTFDSLETTKDFKTSLSTKFKAGVFSFGSSAEVQTMAKQASENSTFFAQLKGDTFGIHPEEPSKLDSWADALIKNFDKECEANKERHEVKLIGARSWASVLTSIPTDSNLDVQNIETLMKAKLTQQYTYQGLTAMANYFANLGVAKPGQKQWIEKLGQTCRDSSFGPYDITGPRAVTYSQLLKRADEVKKLGWSNNEEDIPASERIADFLSEVSDQYKQYVTDANKFIPQVTLKMRHSDSSDPVSYSINAFEQPEMNNGVAQVCFQYSSPSIGRLDAGCKANVTAGQKMPVNDYLDIVPMMIINPKAAKTEDVLTVVNPPQPKWIYATDDYAPTTESCQMAVDIDNPATFSCKGNRLSCEPWKKDRHAYCAPRDDEFVIEYSMLGGDSDSLTAYKYPGCRPRLL
eukprot:Nk52_evm3s1892 gene=Nk52_evmTU3s1892